MEESEEKTVCKQLGTDLCIFFLETKTNNVLESGIRMKSWNKKKQCQKFVENTVMKWKSHNKFAKNSLLCQTKMKKSLDLKNLTKKKIIKISNQSEK